MRLILNLLALCLLLQQYGSGFAHARGKAEFTNPSINNINIHTDTDDNLTALFGDGYRYGLLPQPETGHKIFYERCYLFNSHKLFFTATIREEDKRIISLELSNKHDEDCQTIFDKAIVPATGQNIKPGMKLKEVISIIGVPSEMSIEPFTQSEIERFALINKIPENITPEALISTSTQKRKIPPELGGSDFLLAFGKPENILGFHKVVIYEWQTMNRTSTNLEYSSTVHLHFFKGILLKIVINMGT